MIISIFVLIAALFIILIGAILIVALPQIFNLGKTIINITNNTNDILETVKKDIIPTIQNLASSVDQILPVIEKNLPTIVPAVTDILTFIKEDLIPTIKDNLPLIKNDIIPSLTNILKYINEFLIPTLKKLQPSIDTIVSVVTSINNVLTDISNVISNVIGVVLNPQCKIIDAINTIRDVDIKIPIIDVDIKPFEGIIGKIEKPKYCNMQPLGGILKLNEIGLQ